MNEREPMGSGTPADGHRLTLPFLPRPAASFAATLSAGPPAGSAPGVWLRVQATQDLDYLQLRQLGRRVRRMRDGRADLAPLTPAVVAIVGNGTNQFLEDAIAASAPRHGLDLTVRTFAFNQFAQQLGDPSSELRQTDADYLLLAIDHRGLPFHETPADPDAAQRSLDAAKNYMLSMSASARAAGFECIFQTVPHVLTTAFGSLDLRQRGTLRWLIDAFNRFAITELVGPEDFLFDVAAIAERVGLTTWHDAVAWHLAKAPLSLHCVPIYADALCGLLAAIRGKARKCLVLDLDNTLWGGEIGDVGVGGIVLGQGDPAGEAYQDIQRLALQLSRRGILLAVCSRNDAELARTPFREHADMLLKETDIVTFEVGWSDKTDGIRRIAQRLNIGTDAIVLLDDNPRERWQVRTVMPEVAVPELPADPALVPAVVCAAGYFEAVSFTSEDRARTTYYHQDAARAELRAQVGGDESFLKALAMRLTIGHFGATTRMRATQLINKTNQFNLTTQRMSPEEVEALERDDHRVALWARLEDVIGDNGIVAALVCVKAPDAWTIDTFVMSCRVLGRGVENVLVRVLAQTAADQGVGVLRGRYVPSARNGLAADMYLRLGFDKVEPAAPTGTEWTLRLPMDCGRDIPIELIDARAPRDRSTQS